MEVTGGPHGHDTKVSIDGVKQRGVTRVELEFDVNDVVHAHIHQFVRGLADFEIAEGSVRRTAHVKVFGLKEGDGLLAEATADTVWQALEDCAKQLRLSEGEAKMAHV